MIACYFESNKQVQAFLAELNQLVSKQDYQHAIHTIENTIWQNAWQEELTDLESKKFWLRQLGKDPISSELSPILLAPSEAFGTGQHATTLASLYIIEDIEDKKSVLDVGTGTGVLAIACHKLGYERIVATDIDAQAISSAQENFKINATDAELIQSFPSSEETFDLVIANILVPELLRLIPDLVSRLADEESYLFFLASMKPMAISSKIK